MVTKLFTPTCYKLRPLLYEMKNKTVIHAEVRKMKNAYIYTVSLVHMHSRLRCNCTKDTLMQQDD
jgi:hypothetical protein